MKTYKTWEAFKMLSENPKLEFYNEEGLNRDIIRKLNININNTYFHFNAYRDNVKISEDVGTGRFNGNIKSDDEWHLVQQPVTFMEAVNKILENGYGRLRYEKWTTSYEINPLFNALSISYCNDTLRELLNGKWYVEEEE